MNGDIDDQMFAITKGVVQTGPFAGMTMLRESAWNSTTLSPMLLGCFEEELHDTLEQEIARLALLPNPKVLNVGCSEGYYAIGLARRLPKATVYAVDSSDESLRLAAMAAKANGVDNRIILHGQLDDAFAAPDLVVMDCEGAEVAYLDYEKFPGLMTATMIVETHNWPGKPRSDETLYKRWEASHFVDILLEQGRNPNRFELLIGETSAARWTAVCENRPCLMSWFVMRPKNVMPAYVPQRACGECNLCCELENVQEIEKPAGTMCKNCEVKVGCKIYDDRPRACRMFQCSWLTDETLPDHMRPDYIGQYASGNPASGYMKICASNKPVSFNDDRLTNHVTEKGLHVIFQRGRTVTFYKGEGKDMPKKIALDWTL